MTKEELKELKKQYTKDVNSFSKEVKKYCKKIKLDEMAKNEREAMEYCDLSSALIFINEHLFTYPSYFKTSKILNVIERTEGTKSYILALDVYNMFKNKAELLNAREADIQKNTEIVSKKSAIEKAIKNLQTDENRELLNKYLYSLDSWQPADIINGEININGKNVGKTAKAGVKIGNGTRIHIMDVCIVKNKEGFDVIAVKNNTRWYHSDINIIDTVENIPKELISLIK